MMITIKTKGRSLNKPKRTCETSSFFISIKPSVRQHMAFKPLPFRIGKCGFSYREIDRQGYA
jgi:hypothetical protein